MVDEQMMKAYEDAAREMFDEAEIYVSTIDLVEGKDYEIVNPILIHKTNANETENQTEKEVHQESFQMDRDPNPGKGNGNPTPEKRRHPRHGRVQSKIEENRKNPSI